MWDRIFNTFVTPDVAFFIHVYLLDGDVLATIAVGFGIVWESAEYPTSMHLIARQLVLWSVITETVCSVALFTFDEGISGAQQSKIIALEERLAPRFISVPARNRIVDEMKQFSGQEFDGFIASDVPDAWDIWREVGLSLDLAGWKWVQCWGKPTNRLAVPSCVAVSPLDGVMIYVIPAPGSEIEGRADALAKALTKEGILAGSGPAVGISAANAITIVIGPKPQK